MLIEFRVENYRSLRDEQVLTLEADGSPHEADSRPRDEAGYPKPLLPVAVLYGANASGKSNVLGAIAYMRHAILESHRSWSPDDGVPRDPFAWGSKKDEPSLFEATMLVDSVRYHYGFSVSDVKVEEEWLRSWPHGKKQTWFEREGDDPIKFGEQLKGENRLIEGITRPNALFLSAAVQNRHPQLLPIYSWFRSIRPINVPINAVPLWRGLSGPGVLSGLFEGSRQASLFDDSDDVAERFRSMLRSADVGIVDIKVVKPELEDGTKRLRPSQFFLKHQGPYEEAWLPLDEESSGTRTLFRIGMPILQTLEDGGILIVDELESSLHPSLAQQIVRLFNDPQTNPRNAQLIFTTHDTNLLGTTLGEPTLRRDQVWLTEKDKEGASVLYPLTDYKPRKAENLERGYLQGRYGAIPFLGNFFPKSE